MNKLKYFFINGSLLTIVTLFLRTVSVAFNVYISNKIGAVAMGLFGLISTVYNFGITLATSGINLATTRLVSESLGNGENNDKVLKNIVKKSIKYALFFGLLSASVLFIFAEPLGVRTLGDARTVMSLKVLAVTLPFISVSSALSGYFIAVRRVYKNAIVQILGQFIRIYFCIFLFSLFSAEDVESACLAIVIGGAFSEIISFLIQYFLYIFDKNASENDNVKKVDQKGIIGKILKITLPVAFSSYVRSGLVTLEHLLIPWGLKKSGSTQENSLAAYGTVHSMVFPLVLFPSAISSSFAGLLIPEMAESNAGEDVKRIKRIAQKVFKTILIFSIGTAGLLMCFSYELGETFYPRTDAAKYILMVAPLVPVMYLDTSVDAMLKGLGKQTYTMLINVIDAALSVFLVIILLPKFGITGFIITVYFTEIINATLSVTYLLNVCEIKVKIFEWIAKPLFSIIVATSVIRYIFSGFSIVATNKTQAILHIFIGAFFYLIVLFSTKAIKAEEIKSIIENVKKR